MASRSWLLVDLVLVGLFAVAGRLSHYETLTLEGWWTTAWPFLAATLLGWSVLSLAHRRLHSVTAGVALWLVTLVGGMLLRAAVGQGTALPFVIVAALVLGLVLVVPRVLMRLARPLPRGGSS